MGESKADSDMALHEAQVRNLASLSRRDSR